MHLRHCDHTELQDHKEGCTEYSVGHNLRIFIIYLMDINGLIRVCGRISTLNPQWIYKMLRSSSVVLMGIVEINGNKFTC